MHKTVITFGTFDMFHVGHLNVLRNAKAYGDKLIVGVSSDELNVSKKNRSPVCPYAERAAIIESIKYTDGVFEEKSLELKREYILEHCADVLVMGDDWRGKFDYLQDICDVVYVPRTPSISTSEIIEKIKS